VQYLGEARFVQRLFGQEVVVQKIVSELVVQK
ncbi:hypothetical protein A2U01_0117568, partial [Trifolium medium]|nr:hypothetical protein [Trifolium medium]